MITEVRIQHGSGETFAEHAEKNERGMVELLELLSNNLQLSLEDIEWIKRHKNATNEEILDYIKSRVKEDDKGDF
jgi:hypothetical protein